MRPGKMAARWECSQRTGWVRGLRARGSVIADLRDQTIVDHEGAVAPGAELAVFRGINEEPAQTEQAGAGSRMEGGNWEGSYVKDIPRRIPPPRGVVHHATTIVSPAPPVTS